MYVTKLADHNILEPTLGRPSEKESKATMIPKIW
jgi:hypothetical protein